MRFQNAVVQLAQDFDHIASNVVIVLDQENGRGGLLRRDLPFGNWLLPGACGQGRQVERDGRALAGFACDLDVSLRLLDEAVDLTEAEAGPVPDLLGREERLE